MSPSNIPDDRALTAAELQLFHWLFEHSEFVKAPGFEAQLAEARVVSRCPCGCASIDLSIGGKVPSTPGLREVTDEFFWTSPEGHIYAVSAYQRDNQLAGLEIYSVDGLSTPTSLPNLGDLQTGAEQFNR